MTHFIKNLFLPIFFALAFVCVQGQEIPPTPDTFSSLTKKYTAKELDSLAIVIRQYYYDGNYELVIELAPSLIKQADSANLFKQEYRLRSILGNTFSTLDENEKAFELLEEGLEKAKQKKDTLSLLSTYIDLGNTFHDNNPQKTIGYLEKALELLNGSDDLKRALFITHNNLAEIYVEIENIADAQYHLEKAKLVLDHETLADFKTEYLAVVLHTQGAIYIHQKKFSAAIQAINRSLVLGTNAFDENYLIKNYRNLMTAYENLGLYKNVNDIRHNYDALISKRNEAEKIKRQNIATSKYNLDTYKQQLLQSQLETKVSLQEQEKSNLLLKFFYILFAILLAVLGILFYAQHKKKLLLNDLKLKNQQYLEQKENSEKLAKKNRQFLSTISHELRTPLYGIIGLSSVFLKDPKLNQYSDDFNSLKFSADYLLALVNDVLNLNKFSSAAGKKVHKSYFRIEHLIRSMVQNFEFLNRKNNNNVIIEMGENVPKVLFTDKTKLSQILVNLISNASKFTEDGSIYIRVNVKKQKKDKQLISFQIEDTGKGIPKDEQASIFNEFTQVQNQFVQEGSGLGLSIVNNILNALDSTLAMESESNKGSRFFFELWLESGSLEDIKEEVKVGFGKLKDRHLLIVDDNKINQVVTQKILEQYKMQHMTAAHGKEAVELAEKNSFDAILMDINMPVMNGMEASKRIRLFDKTTPIIALTATDYNTEKNELSSYGINHFIVKPYLTEDLLKILSDNIN